MKRKDPNLTEKLAAFVLTMRIPDENGNLVPLVTREEAKLMTAEQIVSLIQVDHNPVRVETAIALGWTPREYNHPTNLTPLPIMAHRTKTATVDVPEVAKSDRITAEQQEFRRRMLSKSGQTPDEPRNHQTRKSSPMPGSKDSGWRKPMRGPPVRRAIKHTEDTQ